MIPLFLSLRKRAAYLFLALSCVALTACDDTLLQGLGGNGSGPSINPNAPVQVALLVPSGSGQASDDLLARNLENAARLAAQSLSGAQIDLRVYPTAGNPQRAAAQATRAIGEGAKIIIGPLYAEAANAAGLAAAQAGVNVLAFSNNATIAGGNVFVLGSTFNNTANRLVDYATSQGRDRIVVVHAQDVAGQLGREAISQAISRNGATLAGVVDYPLSQQGVVAAVPRIRSAVRSGGANTIFMTATTSAGLPLLTQLMPEQGIGPDVAQYIGLTRWDIPAQTLSLAGVQGGWFAVPDPSRSAAFRSQYRAAYGSEPHPLAGLAFDGVAAVGALVSQGRRNALTAGGLTQGAGFQGATGVFRLRPDGTNERGLAVATIRNSQLVILSPAPNGFGGVGF